MNPTRTRAAGIVVLLLLAGGTSACSFTSGAEEPAAPRPSTAGGPTDPATVPPSTLPDPGVAAGTCALVTYTPPTAVEAFEAELCRPEAPVARDVGIVLVHGGGGVAGDHTAVGAWADAYRTAGFTTLAIDYLLFAPGADGPVFPRPEQNVKAAVQFLRGSATALDLDDHRIVVHGLSAGARLGAVAYTTAGAERFAGTELWPGIDDTVNAFVGFYSTYDGTMQYDRQYYGGLRDDPDPEVRTRWVAADSLVRAGDPETIAGPAALFTGELDWSELIVQQDELASRVRAAGHDAITSVSPSGEHGYDAGPAGLSEAGQIDAVTLVAWLDRQFPQ